MSDSELVIQEEVTEILVEGIQGPPGPKGDTGEGIPAKSIVAAEALAAGDLVNTFNDAGVAKVRKASAATEGLEAHGYVLTAVASGQPAAVYFEGHNTALSGLTPGVQFLSVTAGQVTNVPPAAAGNVVQRVGFAMSATELNFRSAEPITLS